MQRAASKILQFSSSTPPSHVPAKTQRPAQDMVFVQNMPVDPMNRNAQFEPVAYWIAAVARSNGSHT
jgi:hypothetical protein